MWINKLLHDERGDLILSAVIIILLVAVAVVSVSIAGYVNAKLAVADAVRAGERIAEADGYVSARAIAKIRESLTSDNIDVSSLNVSGTSTVQNYGEDCSMTITLTYQVKVIDANNSPVIMSVTIREEAFFQSEKVVR